MKTFGWDRHSSINFRDIFIRGYILIISMIPSWSNALDFTSIGQAIDNGINKISNSVNKIEGPVFDKNDTIGGARSLSDPGGQGVPIYVLWSFEKDSISLFNLYINHFENLNLMGVKLIFVPSAHSDSEQYVKDSCFSSFESFKDCNQNPYNYSSNVISNVVKTNDDILTKVHTNNSSFNGSSLNYMWLDKNGQWKIQYALGDEYGMPEFSYNLGKFIMKYHIPITINPQGVLSKAKFIDQPGFSGSNTVYIFWDPNCSVCHNLFLELVSNSSKLRKKYSDKVSIKWVPIGFIHSDSINKSANIISIGFDGILYDEEHYNGPLESGGASPLPPNDINLISAVKDNNVLLRLFGISGTPSCIWKNKNGALNASVGCFGSINLLLNEVASGN